MFLYTNNDAKWTIRQRHSNKLTTGKSLANPGWGAWEGPGLLDR